MRLVQPELALGQGFGVNLTPAYKAAGFLGHMGEDFGGDSDWGKPIVCAVETTVSTILSQNNPNLEAYRAVNTIHEDPDGTCYEIQYGHFSTTPVKIGDKLEVGDVVAYIGNTGDVYHNGQLVSDAQKQAGSHAGAHLHLQVRAIGKEAATGQLQPHRAYLNDGSGILTLNGFHYYQLYPFNGYASCLDPEQFFSPPVVAPADIKAEVQVMQQSTDPSVKQGLLALIISQLKSLLGL